jgi:hypothetical protein
MECATHPKNSNGGKEENDGMLVLRKSPLNIRWYPGSMVNASATNVEEIIPNDI